MAANRWRRLADDEDRLLNFHIAMARRHDQSCPMSDSILLFIAGIFVLAGFVKGVVGLGLPAVAMGLLALVMPPADAASILVLPTVATNVWQMAAGPNLKPVIARLWPFILGVVCGTLAGAGWLVHGHFGTALLGIALALYALSGLAAIRFSVGASTERWLGPLVGITTGLVAAATGVFAMPAVIYLQAIGMEKEDLVQALGLCFTISSLALAANLASVSALNLSLGPASIGALAVACIGMWAGQILRLRLRPETFRLVFLLGLLALGLYLIGRSVA
jgi:uncharacterized protein